MSSYIVTGTSSLVLPLSQIGASFLSYPSACPDPNIPCPQQTYLNLTQSNIDLEQGKHLAEAISGYVFYCFAGAIGVVAGIGWITYAVQEKIIRI